MRRVIHRLLIASLAAIGAAACGSSTTPTTPTTPAPTVTETFSGTINQNGAVTNPFIAAASGRITATLSAVDPAVNIGLSLGTWDGLACHVVVAADNAAVTAAITASVTSLSSLCVRVYDVGNITDPVAYTVTVAHP